MLETLQPFLGAKSPTFYQYLYTAIAISPIMTVAMAKPCPPINVGPTYKKVVFNISRCFREQKILGEGAYGVVCLATHEPTGMLVAIKKVEPFEKTLLCLRILREIQLLRKFRGHENIVQLYDIQKPLDYNSFQEVYLIQEYMPTDLCKVIRTHILSDEHCQYFTYQILRGLKVIHSANVIHRDLKPSNLLVNDNCDLKICDFGLSRISNDNSFPVVSTLTEYVATRWYRAPEIMLSASLYSFGIDVWSVGCILAELLTYTPLFPGSDYRNQIRLIFNVLGTPKGDDLQCIKSPRAKSYIETLPVHEGIPLEMVINERRMRRSCPLANPVALDLLTKMLMFDPNKRITVDEALRHPYLANYHDPNDEPVSSPMLHEEFYFDLPKDQLNLDILKDITFRRVMSM